MLIDECCTFMIAATQTTTTAVGNIMFFLTRHKEIRKKAQDDIATLIDGDVHEVTDWTKVLTYDNIASELHYITMCVNEALRIDPPLSTSTFQMVTEPTEIGGYKIRNDHGIYINFYALQHNPDEWIDHNEYIPERFDPTSKYFLTPCGKKRNPFSFGPFLGGNRICIGKTFAEYMAKSVVSVIISQLNFEFVDPLFLTKKPMNSISSYYNLPVMVKVTKA